MRNIYTGTMTNFVAGWNMLGYSSDPDHLWVTPTNEPMEED